MEQDRLRLKEQERAFLEEEKKKYPDLFPENTWVDDNSMLETLGIHIPDKEKLPQGFLKLCPSDFIVEEKGANGAQSSVSKDSSGEDEPGETVYATLVKCGLSTLEAVEELAKLLGTTKDKIQYAGIKDKDAITSQHISIRGLSKDKVLEISSPHLFLKDIRTGKGVVTKGGLESNLFTILLRVGADMHDREKLDFSLKALERVRREGFYNFFYLQRFGAPRLNNFRWGIEILKGDYEKALYGLIADPGLREIPYFLEKRKEIISLAPDWSAVLEKLQEFPLVFPSEIKVVSHLRENPNDFLGALRKIEDQVVLWVSAVASLLYNRRLSSYVMAGIEPPATLPLFLSTDKNDWLPYSEDLEAVGIFPPDFNNIRAFRSISLVHKDISTKDHAEISGAEVIPEGIAVKFALHKGEYATTFLSHFVTLLGGKAPEDINKKIIDVKEVLGDKDIKETLEYFQDLNNPKE